MTRLLPAVCWPAFVKPVLKRAVCCGPVLSLGGAQLMGGRGRGEMNALFTFACFCENMRGEVFRGVIVFRRFGQFSQWISRSACVVAPSVLPALCRVPSRRTRSTSSRCGSR